MTRNQKVLDLIVQANQLALNVESGADAFFGNQGISVTRGPLSKPGDVIGTLLQLAGLLPQVAYDVTDPKEALALGLGCKVENLSQELQLAVNSLIFVADDTKRSYARRVPKLVKVLRAFAVALNSAVTLPTTISRQPKSRTVGFTARGVSL